MLERLQLGGKHLALAFDSVTTVTASRILPGDFQSSNDIDQAKDISPIDGLLGSTLLRRHRAYLDFATGTLYLRLREQP
jgi:hypothetical protein